MELLPGLDYETPDILIVQGFKSADTMGSDTSQADVVASRENPFESSEGSKVSGYKAKVCTTADVCTILYAKI